MTKRTSLEAVRRTALATALVLGATSLGATVASAHDDDHGKRHGHHDRGHMEKHDRMGGGFGAMGRGGMRSNDQAMAREATVESVTAFLQKRLERMDNPRLKLGPVTEKGETAIQADIVTQDDSLVWRFDFDRETGRMRPVR